MKITIKGQNEHFTFLNFRAKTVKVRGNMRKKEECNKTAHPSRYLSNYLFIAKAFTIKAFGGKKLSNFPIFLTFLFICMLNFLHCLLPFCVTL